MIRSLSAACVGALIAAGLLLARPALAQDQPTPPAGEEPVKPYEMKDANAGARPIRDHRLFAAFHGREGVARIASDLVERSVADKRISEIFKSHDLVRLKRTLAEQFCYLLGGSCAYTGRDMKTTHADLGIQDADFNALVEELQLAMDKEGVPFRAQNRLLALLAPMHRDVVAK